MMATGTTILLSPRDYDAVLFDLDAVVTNTASTHAAAWKQLFDAFLRHRAATTGETFVPFRPSTRIIEVTSMGSRVSMESLRFLGAWNRIAARQ